MFEICQKESIVIDVIGLGSAGCNIAEKLSEYPQYRVFKIDVGLENTKYSKGLRLQKGPEEYEEKCPSMRSFLASASSKILFIVGGGGDISGCSLRIMQQLKKSDITVLYVKPDISLLEQKSKIHEKVTFGVLQQYARSGVFERLYVVDNTILSNIIGSVPITQYHEKMNDLIASTLHMINVCENSELEMSNIVPPSKIARICTFGVWPFDRNMNCFYNLDHPEERNLFFCIPKKQIETDVKLIDKIKQHVKNKSVGNVRVTFGILPSEYEEGVIYCLESTKFIQGEEKLDNAF